MENVQQDARNEDGPQPHSQAHASPAPELVPSDLNMEQKESEDEGPPTGWDIKYQLKEQAGRLATPAVISGISSDIKTKDVQQDARNEGQQKNQDGITIIS